MSSRLTFTTLVGADIDHELRNGGVERIEMVEGLYEGLMGICALLDHDEWAILAEWCDGQSWDVVLLTPTPGLN